MTDGVSDAALISQRVEGAYLQRIKGPIILCAPILSRHGVRKVRAGDVRNVFVASAVVWAAFCEHDA